MEAANYLLNRSTAEFLDFVEDIFNKAIFTNVSLWDNKIIDEVNIILWQDNHPYAARHFVFDEVVHSSGMFSGHMETQVRSYPVRSYPKVIQKESEALDQHAIGCTAVALATPLRIGQ